MSKARIQRLEQQLAANNPLLDEAADAIDRLEADCMNYRGRLQALLFDLWRDEVLSEQQCAKYHGVDLVSMRRIFDCEAARRGLKDREAAQ